MVEQAISDRFKRIFQVKKVTYDEPAPEAKEQECLWVEIEQAIPTIKDGREVYRVNGSAILIAPNDKIKLGFFGKAIKQADSNDTKDFFFFDLEGNTRRYRNIVQRGFSFVYFFDGQYDPETGSITSVDFDVEEQ